MKGLSGGLLTNAKACMAFMLQYEVLPIWGIQRMEELEEWLSFMEEEPVLDEEMKTKDADGLYDPFFCSGGSEEERYTEILAQGGVAATFLNVGYYTAVLKKAGR